MKGKNRNKMKYVFFAALFALSGILQAQNNTKFRVCLDAGHGNQDFGATYHGYVEKQINLAIVLKLGAILEKDPTIDVIYTRKTDTFIELVERANIANKNKANIFVSIHCNANKNLEAYGSETYVMGLSKSASSLAVARKENEVIKLEDNYKTKYAGYNPNAPESLISATIAQEEYLDQSIELASRIQDNFDQKVNRKNRGVHQAPFMVLHKAFMPRVLVETGFISNSLEGAYLNSEEGQENIARSIADAIFRMKAEHFGGSVPFLDIKKSERPTPKDTTPKNKEAIVSVKEPVKQEPVKSDTKIKTVDIQKVVFKVQLKASNTQIDIKPENFNGLLNVSSVLEGGYYKYMYGETNDYQESRKMLAEVKSKGYQSAFLVPYKNGVKISLNEAVKSAK
ncbi:N-acetylmuramoyl-L-alanine amidase family protein [Flavobacterium oreochromis]|uniref:N-acetylmuramoyl-L-alanine amidase n=3 Tax=Flavobacterium TaxID=237 RepID=A0A246GB47_9FLAO|nr:N-acetylmuramoyl-L-alanine amidase [Flavobacterium oreochromis]OWP78036.1 N-acetylmuramoyl-L-alanine amidase [Flavobacterium oreochromis]POR24370.1 N-acetylmuramoyl-L-alanine amidase [Flavobacterium columnare]